MNCAPFPQLLRRQEIDQRKPKRCEQSLDVHGSAATPDGPNQSQ